MTTGNDSDRSLLIVDSETSARMGRIRQASTKPELLVRRALRQLGVGYRLKNRDLPGSPDIANRSGKWAIFVHGCYWHSHEGCPRATVPKRNRSFWEAKFAANRARDSRVIEELKAMGYRTLIIWECDVYNDHFVIALSRFFS